MVIIIVRAELFRADRDRRTDTQTNIKKPVAAVRNLAKATKNGGEKIKIYIKVIRECGTQEVLFYKI